MAIGPKLIRFYEHAQSYVRNERSEELEEMQQTSSPDYFQRLTQDEFMREYAWTVYAAGFKNAVLEKKFSALEKAFEGFSLDRICRMTSTAKALSIINHTKKAEAVLEGARLISKIGFSNLKEELVKMGPDALVQLPYIGPVNKNQLARNIGLASLHKNDVWIRRLVKLSNSNNDAEMIEELSQRFGERPGIVDLNLWRFCADNAWKISGHSDLDKFYRSL
jgi:3-methyladenine DNA glycosylase Tag